MTSSSAGKTSILQASGLRKTYGSGDDAVVAVDGIDFEIERGTVVGLLGPNGAGKTTTIKLLLGLIEPDDGTVQIDDIDPISNPKAGYDRVSAMLEGARNVYWRLTVRENLRFFARLADQPADPDRIEGLLEQVGLVEKADEPVNDLSRGMKQKASLACTLIRETPLAFLDEPTLGLDVESSLELRRQLRSLVETESRTIVLSSHDMDVIEAVCDRVIIMNEGRMVADNPLEDLLDVFRAQSYRLTLASGVSAEGRTALERKFGATAWDERDGKVLVTIPNVQSAEFYDLVETLRMHSCRVLSIEPAAQNLERVFLDLTGGQASAAESRRTDPTTDAAERPLEDALGEGEL